MKNKFSLPFSSLEIAVLDAIEIRTVIGLRGRTISNEIKDIAANDFFRDIEELVVKFFLERGKKGSNIEKAVQLCKDENIQNGNVWPFIVNTAIKELAFNAGIARGVRKRIKKKLELV